MRAAWREAGPETMKEETTAPNSGESPRAPINRREGITLAAASAMASLLPAAVQAASRKAASSKNNKESAMTNSAAIRPFHYETSKDELADLKKRIAATKWPDREQVADDSQGVQL